MPNLIAMEANGTIRKSRYYFDLKIVLNAYDFANKGKIVANFRWGGNCSGVVITPAFNCGVMLDVWIAVIL